MSTVKIHLRGKMNQAPITVELEVFHDSFPLLWRRRGSKQPVHPVPQTKAGTGLGTKAS